jgi:alkylated DNA nucleotide flippase Atl1
MSYISEKVERVLEVLQREKTRCTYGALAELIGASPRDVGVFLDPKRPEASWVVNKKTGMPTGYKSFQIHPELQTYERVIERGEELKRLLA